MARTVCGPTNSTALREISMDIKPVSKKSIYEDIVRQIRSMIDSGKLRPGDRLPPEREMAAMFRVSRNTVREAIRALAEKDLVESRQGSGTFVRDAGPDQLVETLARAIQCGKTRLQDIFQARMLIEPEISRLAAENATDDDVFKLRQVIREQKQAILSGQSAQKHDNSFHELIAAASGNSVLLELVTGMHGILYQTRTGELQFAARQDASLAAHARIVEAIASGNGQEAADAMKSHLVEIESMVLAGEI